MNLLFGINLVLTQIANSYRLLSYSVSVIEIYIHAKWFVLDDWLYNNPAVDRSIVPVKLTITDVTEWSRVTFYSADQTSLDSRFSIKDCGRLGIELTTPGDTRDWEARGFELLDALITELTWQIMWYVVN